MLFTIWTSYFVFYVLINAFSGSDFQGNILILLNCVLFEDIPPIDKVSSENAFGHF